jgi:transposase
VARSAGAVRSVADGVEAAHRFATDGTWDRVLTALQAQADAEGGIDWRLSADSTSARVHQHGATAARSSSSPLSHTGGTVE